MSYVINFETLFLHLTHTGSIRGKKWDQTMDLREPSPHDEKKKEVCKPFSEEGAMVCDNGIS